MRARWFFLAFTTTGIYGFITAMNIIASVRALASVYALVRFVQNNAINFNHIMRIKSIKI